MCFLVVNEKQCIILMWFVCIVDNMLFLIFILYTCFVAAYRKDHHSHVRYIECTSYVWMYTAHKWICTNDYPEIYGFFLHIVENYFTINTS